LPCSGGAEIHGLMLRNLLVFARIICNYNGIKMIHTKRA
jgi:hypothetical protein